MHVTAVDPVILNMQLQQMLFTMGKFSFITQAFFTRFHVFDSCKWDFLIAGRNYEM